MALVCHTLTVIGKTYVVFLYLVYVNYLTNYISTLTLIYEFLYIVIFNFLSREVEMKKTLLHIAILAIFYSGT